MKTVITSTKRWEYKNVANRSHRHKEYNKYIEKYIRPIQHRLREAEERISELDMGNWKPPKQISKMKKE